MNDIPDAEHLIQIFAFYHPPLVRGRKHLQEVKGGNPSNCMVIHNRTFTGDPNLNFRMERKGVFKTPLSRQVNEALRIKNSCSEWRADALPTNIQRQP